MQNYTAKPAKPATVQAVQYVAPNGADVVGNVDELLEAGADVRPQNPWNPAGGQHSVIVVNAAGTELLEDGGYLVLDGGEAHAYTAAEFTAAYDAVPDLNK